MIDTLRPKPVIASVAPTFPKFSYTQEDLTNKLGEVWHGTMHNSQRLHSIHQNTQVLSRHLALPAEKYIEIENFTEANKHYVICATELGTQSLKQALEKAEVKSDELDAIFFTSVT